MHKLLCREHKTSGKASCDLSGGVSVIIPCLNEAKTLLTCIQSAKQGLKNGNYSGEIIVADNGSTDGCQAIAKAAGAEVVEVQERGYGAAILMGMRASKGKWALIGDADCSYDFRVIPSFVEKLRCGFDLVMGNRFSGKIMSGAMPWHHRYIGNPLLSGVGRMIYRPNCRDFHCGMRAFDLAKISGLGLRCTGMEFASEMVMAAACGGLEITEIPIVLYPDQRCRRPHLRSFRDGWRHLSLLIRGLDRSNGEIR